MNDVQIGGPALSQTNAHTLSIGSAYYLRLRWYDDDHDFDNVVWYQHTSHGWNAKLSDELCEELESTYRQAKGE